MLGHAVAQYKEESTVGKLISAYCMKSVNIKFLPLTQITLKTLQNCCLVVTTLARCTELLKLMIDSNLECTSNLFFRLGCLMSEITQAESSSVMDGLHPPCSPDWQCQQSETSASPALQTQPRCPPEAALRAALLAGTAQLSGMRQNPAPLTQGKTFRNAKGSKSSSLQQTISNSACTDDLSANQIINVAPTKISGNYTDKYVQEKQRKG